MPDFDHQVTSVAALGEPVRRELYRFVANERDPVSREQAAESCGVAQHVAKFHLDRLEQDGLLECEYRRPPGRTGPGAGRPTKLYRRAAREIDVSLPQRRYDLAARVLADAVSRAGHDEVPLERALHSAATDAGHQLADAAGESSLIDVLAEHGYEPFETEAGLALGNCPFHALATEYTALVCGLNRDLVRGLLRGLDERGARARLDPGPNRCCVLVTRAR